MAGWGRRGSWKNLSAESSSCASQHLLGFYHSPCWVALSCELDLGSLGIPAVSGIFALDKVAAQSPLCFLIPLYHGTILVTYKQDRRRKESWQYQRAGCIARLWYTFYFPTGLRLSVVFIPVWHPCNQIRCPSYWHWQRRALLEKSDSATSCLGFTTTWQKKIKVCVCVGGEGWLVVQVACSLLIIFSVPLPSFTKKKKSMTKQLITGAKFMPRKLLRNNRPSQIPSQTYLEYVTPRRHISDIYPLAVNIMSVCIPAAYTDTLLSKISTAKTPLHSCMEKKRLNRRE